MFRNKIFTMLQPLAKPAQVSEKGQYIICNEQCQEETLTQLAAKKKFTSQDNTVHIGFSVWFNLDLLAVTQPRYAIILDIDPAVSMVYIKLQESLNISKNPAEFVKHFLAKLSEEKGLISWGNIAKELNAKLTAPVGFLSSLAQYKIVKAMCDEGRIFFGQADLTSTKDEETELKDMQLIAKWCDANNMQVESLYLSNIPEWINEYNNDKMSALIHNVRELINKSKSIFVIDAFYPTNERFGSGPPQRVTEGDIPSFKKKNARKNYPPSFLSDDKSPSKQDENVDPNPNRQKLIKRLFD